MPAFALISWPIVSLVIFAILGPARGLIWTVTIGYLFLPERYGFDLPALPPYNKYSAIAYASLLGVLLFRSREAKQPHLLSVDPLFRNVLLLLFFILLVVSPVLTSQTNPEVLVNGPLVRPALTIRDAIRLSADMVIWLMPMLLAWKVLTRPEHHRELLIAIVTFGVIYSVFVIFERRMSPQLNNWVYGYFPHSWLQHIRGGGFRPIVFLQHGLVVGFFLLTATLSAVALSRDKHMSRGTFVLLAAWLFLTLSLSRNFGALLLAIVFLPMVFIVSPRLQVRVAVVIAALFLTYPLLKQYGLSPDWWFLELVEPLSPDRAQSFRVRLESEDALLARAFEKPLFGWGGWARAHIVNEFGRDMRLIDGIWIVILGQRGWLGYIGFFGIIVLPLFFLRRAARRKPLPPVIAGMAVITAANLIDMIPNSTLSPLGLLILGALAAFVQFDIKGEAKATAEGPDAASHRQTRYTRFAPESRPETEALSRYRRF